MNSPFNLIQVFLNSGCQIVFPPFLNLYHLLESLRVRRKKMHTKKKCINNDMTFLLGEKKNLPFHQHLCQKLSFRNWKEKGLYFLHIFYRKHFLVLCHGLGFHTLVASHREMDMAMETSWLWNPDSKISRKMRKVWGTLNDSCSNKLRTCWGDFRMAANATCLWPVSWTLWRRI